ncbi:hypothetical protein Aab01nite_13920 [Paractinoplanes abujensis]|uniref:Uncharacterized protein n=1 Tax=Paractinoplanes abujensis TaxID=882441 RepID=A0A7W7CPA5_9ACTN|nr:hypothetical protein [Actinoplanes abujensis]MBB4690785.1 hypothetical protein [Actinoplanes abujensis]GID17802.1 hypothetical protein Aab01nite_13920 [Actinoplanes abujensis]
MIAGFWAPAPDWITPSLPLYGNDHERRDFAPSASGRTMPLWTPPPLWPPWALQHG